MVCLKHSFIHTSIYLQHGSDIKIQIQTHTKYNNHKGKRSTGYITDILVSWLSRLNFCLLKKKKRGRGGGGDTNRHLCFKTQFNSFSTFQWGSLGFSK